MRKRQVTGTTRYAIYLRCSSDDQAEGDFTTIDAQREITSRRVIELGGVRVAEYADEGKSGTNLNRNGWKQLLADAQAGKFDAVCVSYMSRLGRGRAYTIAEYELEKAGVAVELVREQFTDDMAGYLNKNMTVLMDGLYARQVSQWTRTKQQQMVEHGYFTGGQVPFGYRSEYIESASSFTKGGKEPPKRLIPHETQAPVVRQAFELFATSKAIVKAQEYLRAETGEEWDFDRVKRLLTNDRYRGVLRFGALVNYTAHEPIVSEALWDMAQEALQNRTRARRSQPKDKTFYYLRGRVFCQECGCRMTPADHHGMTGAVRYYECTAAHKKQTPCTIRRVNAFTLHETLLSEIRRAVEHPTRLTELIRAAVKKLPAPENLKSESASVARRLVEVDKKIANITAAIETGGSRFASLLTRLEDLEKQQKTIQAEKAELAQRIHASEIRRPSVEDVQKVWGRFTELWEKATEEEREALMPLLVDRVDMEQKERGNARLLISAAFPRSFVGLTPGLGARTNTFSTFNAASRSPRRRRAFCNPSRFRLPTLIKPQPRGLSIISQRALPTNNDGPIP